MEEHADAIRIFAKSDAPYTAANVKTQPHPGFPTDLQPQMLTLLSTAKGTSLVAENVWDNRLLTILEEEDVKATFFMSGNRAQSIADRIRRMQSLGMELGSHTYDHTQLTKLDESALAEQIEKTNAAIMNAAGTAPTLLRPPYGSYNAAVKAAAGVPIVLWSLDSQDWKSHSADAVYQKVLTEVQDGSAILFHDIYDTSVDAAKRLIPALKEHGYEMVTVSELAKRKGKALSPGDVFSKG